MKRLLSLVLLSLALPAAVSAVNYNITYTDGAGEGFNDATLGVQRKAALDYAVHIWASRLAGTVTLEVTAHFDPLGGSAGSAILAQAGPSDLAFNPSGAPRAAIYPASLANQLNGSDGFVGTEDIDITFNGDVDNNTVLGTVNWYYGLDENAGTNVSMVRTSLHELGHGLGFLDSIDDATGLFANEPTPFIFDTFLRQGSGPGTALTSQLPAARKTAIISNNLFWEASTNVSTAFGSQPQMYAPGTYEPGSSVSHFNEAAFTPEQLMEPVLSSDFIDLGLTDDALKDFGYTLIGPATLPTVAFTVAPGAIVAENAGVQSFTVTRSGDTSEAVTFSIALSGAATNGVDYAISQTSFTIPIGSATASFTISPVADGVDEGVAGLTGEDLVVTIASVLKAGYGASNSVTINLNDSASDVGDWLLY